MTEKDFEDSRIVVEQEYMTHEGYWVFRTGELSSKYAKWARDIDGIEDTLRHDIDVELSHRYFQEA